ncbi:lytic murein transglycosylase [Bdellovibrio bacteriovorus]|uniref:Lytic murein transglycosylase n=1 Tax=Bdellovibrio bacteriovorus TaxID=959 RepID=A0A161PQB3_BDEBC|nr:lytic transglycosylase domain-containing protein [Bdellovibrio bacteriovorus]KYG62836.1 lytic murein transglycosylase [Bdellovibrio bacteriovorus]
MPKIILAFSFFSVILGCATTSRFDTRIDKRLTPPVPNFISKWKNAPVSDLEKLEVGAKEDNIRWWKTYTLAMAKKTTAPKEACEGFKSLSSENDFPLHDLALLRAYETCVNDKALAELPGSTVPWYRDLLVDIKLKEALETSDLRDDMTAYVEKARLDNNKKNKEEFYLKALLAAQKSESKEDIEQIQTALYKNSPRLNPLPLEKDLSNVASDYRFHREFDHALKTYKKILASEQTGPDEYFQTLKNIRQTYKVAQQRSDYINATADLVNWSKKQFQKSKKDRRAIARYHDAQVLFAKTLWTEDQTSQAVKVLNETHRLLRGIYPMDEVYFIQGRIDEEKGNFTKALEYFEASYQQPVSLPGLRDKIAWLKSWNYYKLEKWEEAKTSFEQMRDLVKDPADKSRARFWLARSLEKLGKNSDAQNELQGLIKEDPLGYYGVLAVRELKQSFTPLKIDNKELQGLSLLGVSELDPQMRLTTEWLISVDEKPFAEKVLNIAVEDLKKKKVTSEETWLAISSGYARTGLYLPLFSAIGALDSSVKDRLLNDHPDLLFPQPFSDIIAQASDKSGTPQAFIYAIIRQESAFNPEARSSVDAFGLMQLLPSVAKQLAKRNSLEYSEANDLFKPEINIPLGAFELKSLMKKYDDQFILAVSGYNANDSAIRGWLKTRFREDSVEFIEEVPYEETRAYIKLVMRNYIFYQRLLNTTSGTPFPEELLSLKSNKKKDIVKEESISQQL